MTDKNLPVPFNATEAELAQWAAEDERFLPDVPDQSYSTSGAVQSAATYMIFKPEYAQALSVHRPSYEAGKQSRTVFRPFPARSVKSPTGFFPYRIAKEDGDYVFGYWRRTLKAAHMLGDPAVCFLLHDPAKGIYNQDNPVECLIKAIRAAKARATKKPQDAWALKFHKNPPFEVSAEKVLEWSALLEGGEGRSAVISRPNEITLMQGFFLMERNQKCYGAGKTMPGWGLRNPTAVLYLTRGPSRDLTDMLNQENPSYRGNPDDFERRYLYGDPVNPDAGRYIVMSPKGTLAEEDAPVDVESIWQDNGPAANSAESRDQIGFDIDIVPSFEGIPAKLADKAMAAAKWHHWDKILWFPTPQEQVELLRNRIPDDLLFYAMYGEHTDWLPPSLINRVGSNSVITVSGGVITTPQRSNPAIAQPRTSAAAALPFAKKAQPSAPSFMGAVHDAVPVDTEAVSPPTRAEGGWKASTSAPQPPTPVDEDDDEAEAAALAMKNINRNS